MLGRNITEADLTHLEHIFWSLSVLKDLPKLTHTMEKMAWIDEGMFNGNVSLSVVKIFLDLELNLTNFLHFF